jgi:hypothetical protein
LDANAPMPSLRPACPWERSAAKSPEEKVVEYETGDPYDENYEQFAPQVFTEEDVGRCDVDRSEHSPDEDEIRVFERLERNSTVSSTCGSSARAEVERAVHSAFLEECERGCSPTAAAVEAIRRCRSSMSRESMKNRGPLFNESHRLLLKEGEDGMGITA